MISLWLIMLFLVMVMVIYKYSFPSKKKLSALPPSPPGLPIIGNLHQLGAFPHRSLQALAKKYGHLMLLKFGNVHTMVLSSAEAAEEVMKIHDLSFASRPTSVMADILLYGTRDIAFSPYGEYWRKVRRIGVRHLLNAKQIRSFRHIIEDEVLFMVHKIRSATRARVNLSGLLITLTNDIISTVTLGGKYSSEEDGSNKYRDLTAEFANLLGAFPFGDYIPCLAWVDKVSGLLQRARRNALELDKFIEQVLNDHVKVQEASFLDAKDFVDIILTINKEDTMGTSLSRDSVKAIILDMFGAGTDTAFTILEWIMAELIKHPAILMKVQDEVRKNAIGIEGTCITDDHINKMIYLKAVIKESLRLHPPIPLLTREAITSSKLYGFEVPAKTRVIINAWAIGRDPKYWDEPDEFIPDRFINSPLDFKGFHFQFLPFGAGRRICPGISFVMSTIELAIANLLYHFNWELPDGLKGEEIDMAEEAGNTIHKKLSLLLIATPQKNGLT